MEEGKQREEGKEKAKHRNVMKVRTLRIPKVRNRVGQVEGVLAWEAEIRRLHGGLIFAISSCRFSAKPCLPP